nr:zinc phosphodiesterase [Hymenolepis microstoma]
MAPSSRIHVTVVGTGSPGSPKSVLLCTDKTRYLINCGEVLECPHESYIPRFLQADSIFSAIESFQASSGNIRGTVPGINLVIHMVPEGLFESPKYQDFVNRLNQYSQKMEPVNTESQQEQPGEDELHHLVLDGSSDRPACSPITGIFSQSAVLNTYFDSQVYPKLDALRSSKKPDLSKVESFSKVVYAEPMLKYGIRPHSGFSTENCIVLNEQELIKQCFEPLYVTEDEAVEKCRAMREEVESALIRRSKDTAITPLNELDWPEFTFLGTASSSPSKYRNISAILVRLSPNDCILLDCAEGTLNQFYALYGIEETHRLLRGLKLILITHMHADHHGGVLTIARKVHELINHKDGLAVLAPSPFWRWVNNYSELFNSSSTKHVRLFCINSVYNDPMPSHAPSASEIDASSDQMNPIWQLKNSGPDVAAWVTLLSQLKLKVEPVKVPHTGTSWGYVISRPKEGGVDDGALWKVVYSGDTPPCSHLAKAGRDCDLLIHEATMGDGYEEQAVNARHSTTGEAIQIGRMMQAKFILLTHFSQRFSRLPSFDTFQEDIAPAFDFMQVKFRDLWKLPYFLPYYKYAFAKHWELLQNRADANQQKKKLKEEALQKTRSAVSDALCGSFKRREESSSS